MEISEEEYYKLVMANYLIEIDNKKYITISEPLKEIKSDLKELGSKISKQGQSQGQYNKYYIVVSLLTLLAAIASVFVAIYK